MEIKVRVKAGSKENKVEKKDDYYLVSVKAKAREGRANKAVLKLLKKYFKKQVRILRGIRSREKVVEI